MLVTKRWTHIILSLAFMMSASGPTLARDVQKSLVQERWRPKDGLYASPGKGFAEICQEFGDLTVGLRENDIGGHEWGCKIGKLTDIGPSSIKIEMTCSDYNLAEDLKKPDETEFKEVILLKKIDGRSMLVRKTVDGKFKDPEWKAVYCPKDAQRMFLDAQAKNKADAEQEKAAEKMAWQPRDGIYANAGANFDDRCTRSGDAVIRLAQSSLSIGGASCYVAHVWRKPPDVVLDVNCGQSLIIRGTSFEPPAPESVILSKMDDQSILLRRVQNGQAPGTEQRLRYCPEAAQRAYVDSIKAK